MKKVRPSCRAGIYPVTGNAINIDVGGDGGILCSEGAVGNELRSCRWHPERTAQTPQGETSRSQNPPGSQDQ
nr:hypothetical protein [Oscillatoria sp. PCC 10802]